MLMDQNFINGMMIMRETITNRIKVYFEQTAPLIDYYRRQNKLVEIDGTQPIEKVTDALLSATKKTTVA